jgi:hypothetical protein
MAHATIKTPVSVDPHSRSTFFTEVKKLSNRYSSWTEEIRTIEPDFNQAILVGSKNGSGLHLPALDLDGKVALTKTDTGYALWVDAPGSAFALRRLRKLLVRTGISPNVVPSKLHPQLVYALERDHAVDTAAITKWLLAKHVGFAGSYDGLLLAANCATDDNALVQGPLMSHPYRIPLQVQALLIDSTSNHHLYLERSLSMEDYRALLKALKRAGVIERGFCDLSIKRGGSFLRLPWVSKK